MYDKRKKNKSKNNRPVRQQGNQQKTPEQMIRDLQFYIKNLEEQNRYLSDNINDILNSTCWQITSPLRFLGNTIKRTFHLPPGKKLLNNIFYTDRRNDIPITSRKEEGSIYSYQNQDSLKNRELFTEEDLDEQRKHSFSKNITFSIAVPLFNTPKRFLKEMIESVQSQTYSNWELCLADGSSTQHSEVEKICRKYTKKDSRIRYKKLEKNLGITGNTNACLEMAEGSYIGLLDHDDLLHPSALYEVMKAICDKNADFIYTDETTFHKIPNDAYCPNYKPDFAPDTLRSYNYICHFSVFSRSLLNSSGQGFCSVYEGSQDYDLILRLTEQAKTIVHIPKILYYWRAHSSSTAMDISAKSYAITAAKRAITQHLERVGLKGIVEDSRVPSTYRVQYEINSNDLVSIIIPNKDHIDDLKKCINSIKVKSTYKTWEIIIIENNSVDSKTFAYYENIKKDERIKIVRFEGSFNFSAINNYGAKYADGKYLLLLNNDTEVISPDWIEQMLMFAQREDVGAVGAMLYYPDDTVQHAGIILGIGGVAGHSHKYFKRNDYGYMSRMSIAQNLSGVTAACMMIPLHVWKEINGFDDKFAVAFNDVDLCMRIRQAGYLIVWTPYAELYHYESKSRGCEDTDEKRARFKMEVERFQSKWAKELAAGDPYYNPNLNLDKEDFSVRI